MHVHIVTEFTDAMRGNEQRTLHLCEAIAARCGVSLWTESDVDPRLVRYPIRRIDPLRGEFPRGGTLLIVGVFVRLGEWLEHATPDRTIVVYNTSSPETFPRFLERLGAAGIPHPEIVYAANWLMESTGIPGVVHPSHVDIERFRPAGGPRPDRAFTVGRLSRDVPEKFHAGDDALYAKLAAEGCAVRIMGGTCLGARLPRASGVELLPEDAEPAERFLHTLDCFYYRTADSWLEAFGRVIVEAMACGVPVVAHWRGGYAEWIDDGEDGFLIESPEEAYAVIARLRADWGLHDRVARAARHKAEALYGREALERMVDYYAPRAES